MQDWDDLKLLLTLSRAGNFAATAVRLGIDETTVARRLRRAEARIGERLVHRAGHGLTLTKAGETLRARAEEIERLVEAGEAEITGAAQRVEGTVRLTAVPLLVNRLLAPAVPALLAAHPGLTLELIPDARDYALSRREADLALRLARPRAEAAMLCRRVGQLGFAVYGAEDAPWIGYVPERAALPQAAWQTTQAGRSARVHVADIETAIALVEAGAGRAALPRALLPESPSKSEPEPPDRELWLLSHPDTQHLPRMRAVADWIAGLCHALE